MKSVQEKREARERERARRLRARERTQNRKSRKREERARHREQERARKEQKRERIRAEHGHIKAGEDNLFNGVSTITHALATKALSNLRLSLGLRISWNYTVRQLSIMFRELLLCMLIFVAAEWIFLARNVRTQGAVATQAAAVWTQDVQEIQIEALPAVSVRFEQGNEALSLLLEKTQRFTGGVLGVRVQSPNGLQVAMATSARDALGYPVLAVYDLSYHVLGLYGVLALVATINLISALGFILAGRRINQKVLAPIGQITETAQMLSENDLGQRINVEGTNNELKDLALVINAMLDRIELAYNAQKQFVSDASHELRTPIAVIQGYANLLERWGKDSPEVRDEAIAAILSESGAMKELVEKLLFLARHDKQTLRLKNERFDVREVIEETLRETRMMVKDREVLAGEMQGAVVEADRSSIKQALRIFVDNAVKYTPAGGTVTVSCVKQGTDVAICVKDTGVGISGSELSAIFERFYRADTARSGDLSGHGLGLSIAKIIVLSHKGRIRVKSKLGAGSSFIMELPRV